MAVYFQAPSGFYRAQILRQMYAQERFPVEDRLKVLAVALQKERSVRAASEACWQMNKEAKLNKNLTGWMDYLAWFEKWKQERRKRTEVKAN